MKPFRLIGTVFALLLSNSLLAQIGTPVPLNSHFFEINPKDSLNHQYNRLKSYTADSVLMERTFDLNNRLIMISKTAPKDSVYQEKVLEYYLPTGDLREKVIINLANTKYIASHFLEGKQVAQVLYRGENKHRISRELIDEDRESLYNDFEPNPIESKRLFYDYITERVTFSTSQLPRNQQLAVIAIYVDEQGNPTNTEWANPLGCEPQHAERYLKAVKSWKYGYTPARDVSGNPVGRWRLFYFYLPRLIRGPEVMLSFLP